MNCDEKWRFFRFPTKKLNTTQLDFQNEYKENCQLNQVHTGYVLLKL